MNKGTCKHFNGSFHNECCRAGVNYDSVTTEPERQVGKALRIPCHCVSPFTSVMQLEEHAKRGTCNKYEEPSDEEIAEHNKAIDRLIANHMKSEPLISRIKKEQRGKNWDGIEKCPVCGGKLHMTHAAYNDHVHGKCETKDCLNWME